MADVQVLGLFYNPEPVAEAVAQLRARGVPVERLTIMSAMPYKSAVFGMPRPRQAVGRMAQIGAILGVATAAFLTAGIYLLYPLLQGGQPLIPIPPSLIVFFEMIMLGTMWVTFFAFLGANRFPAMKKQVYDPQITEQHLGLVAEVDERMANEVEAVLRAVGAHALRRAGPSAGEDRGFRLFWITVAALVLVVGALSLLFFYDLVRIPFPTQMLDQDVTAFEQGPRLAAPVAAVPVQGPDLLAGQPASLPVAAMPSSLQRGAVLYGIHCALCHGDKGQGDGKMAGFFNPPPFDLTGATVQKLADGELFMVISQGRGAMPSLAENLSPEERWDVINHIRTLKKQ